MQKTYSIHTRSHATFRAMVADLSDKARGGILTVPQLSTAIDLYYDDGDYIDRSIGTTWILEHPELFSLLVPEPERLAFLMEHLDRAYSSELLICDEKVLATLPPADRAKYVFEAYGRDGARNSSWIAAALAVGILKEDLVLAIQYRLETAAPTKERTHVSAIGEFLRYGDQGRRGSAMRRSLGGPDLGPEHWHVPADSLWGVCGEEDFHALIVVCAEKEPHSIFGHWRKLTAKLPLPDVRAILKLAAAHLERYPDAIDGLLQLDQATREDLLKRLTPTSDDRNFIEFLACTAIAAADPQAVYQEHAGKLDVFDVIEAFQVIASLPVLRGNHPTAGAMKERFQTRLEAAGYRIGRLVRKTYQDRKRGERSQLCVEVAGIRYVEDRSSHRYAAVEGEEVIFSIRQGNRLTPNVTAVYFTPTDISKRH